MSAFDEVLPKVVAAVVAAPFYATLTGVTIIRDLKGRVRLLLEFPPMPLEPSRDQLPANWEAEKQALRTRLQNDLGPYWGDAIWRGRHRSDAAYLATANAIRTERQPWQSSAPAGSAVDWYKLERQFSKSSWAAAASPPWPVNAPASPAIVAFYSFKGGVGRTVALSSVALLLARAGHDIVVVDLDLEAPGAAPFLMGATPLPDDGVVDYLVEWQLTGVRPVSLAPFVAIQTEPALVNATPIRVISSGRVNTSFVEKVARLDFESYARSPVNPLAELLRHISDEFHPAFILLDVRSGLHDLGGLSLNMLSHLNLIFSRDAAQAWAGMETVLTILGEHHARPDMPEVLVVHSMVPPNDPDAHARFQARSYQLFQNHYFSAADPMPDIASLEAPYGLPIQFQDSLQNAVNAASLHPATDCGGSYIELTKRIGTLIGRHTLPA